MSSNPSRDADHCDKCGKSYNDLARGTVFCRPCQEEADVISAKVSVFGHLKSAAACFFNFHFGEAIVEVVWAIMRLTRTGAYGKGGKFTKLLKGPR